MTYDYDVVFIGSGHANWHAAVILSQVGKKWPLLKKILRLVLVPIMAVVPNFY